MRVSLFCGLCHGQACGNGGHAPQHLPLLDPAWGRGQPDLILSVPGPAHLAFAFMSVCLRAAPVGIPNVDGAQILWAPQMAFPAREAPRRGQPLHITGNCLYLIFIRKSETSMNS